MIEDSVQVSLTPADTGETGYRMLNAAVSATEGSLAEAAVQFVIDEGSGGLGAEKKRALEIETDEWGIAQVNWHAEAYTRSDPQASEQQSATIRAITQNDSARTLRLHIAQTTWLPPR